MPAKKGGPRQKGFDITGLTDFRPPQLSQNIVLPQPQTPPSHGSTPPLQSVNSSKLHLPPSYRETGGGGGSGSGEDYSSSYSQHQLQYPPALNLNDDQQQSNPSSVNTTTSLWNQLAAPTGGILFHHTTDKDQYIRSKSSKSSHHNKRALDSERLLYVLNVYQFVIHPDSLVPQVHPDILRAMLSFDEFPPWLHICAVVQNGEFEEFTCPICLDTPQAPRMTHCGHVFCSACWNAHATERGNVALKLSGKEKFSTHHPHLDEVHRTAASPATTFGGSGVCTNALDVTCPVCSKPCRASATKPLLFVPSSHQRLESTIKPVEFTRLQRLRRAPVFFRPKPEHDGIVLDKATTNSTANEFTRNASGFDATPLTTVTTKTNQNETSASGMFPRSSSAAFGTLQQQQTELLDLIPSLCVDNADDATLCSRYVAFNAKVLIDWAEGQMISLSEQKIELEESLAAVMVASAEGPDASLTEKANPMVLALKSQLTAVDCAIRQLSREVDMAQKAPSPMPKEFVFPAGLIDRTSSPENVVDLYRRTGTGAQLFLHPMTTRMIQENAIAKHEKLPETISCCIEDVETITQNVELRNHKSFSHIPLGASYQVAFCDLRNKLVPEIARKFDQGIEERKDKIKRMLQREARIEKKSEEYMNYVNQVRAERQHQLLMDFGYQSDLNSTSMLNDADIAKRNAEAFAVNLEESYLERQQSDISEQQQQGNTKNSNNKKKQQTKNQQNSSAWRDNLPSLGDLPSDPNDHGWNPPEGYNYYHNVTTSAKTTTTAAATTTSTTAEKKPSQVVFVKLGGNNNNNNVAGGGAPSLDAMLSSATNNASASATTSASASSSQWGKNSPSLTPATSGSVWGKTTSSIISNAENVGKPLSFSEMIKKNSGKPK